MGISTENVFFYSYFEPFRNKEKNHFQADY